MTDNPFKLEPVTSDAERRLRRTIRAHGAVILLLAFTMVGVMIWQKTAAPIFVFVPIIIGLVTWTAILASDLGDLHKKARDKLRREGYKFCARCEYDLATLPDEGLCPECGSPYTRAELEAHWEHAYKRLLDKPGR